MDTDEPGAKNDATISASARPAMSGYAAAQSQTSTHDATAPKSISMDARAAEADGNVLQSLNSFGRHLAQ